MTREEQLACLKDRPCSVCCFHTDRCNRWTCVFEDEPEDQDPCGNAVNRQAVLDITWEEPSYTDALNVLTEVRDKVKALPPVNPQETKTIQEKQAESEKYQKAFDDGYENGYAQARFDYEQEPKWIPVSERLPKAFEFVNCTCHSLIDDREDWTIETVYVPQSSDSPYSDWGNIPMLNSGNCEVVAWMHRNIPEPYKAESEVQK